MSRIIDIQMGRFDSSRTVDTSPTGFPIIVDEMSFRQPPSGRTQIPVNEFIPAGTSGPRMHRYVLRSRSIDMQGRPRAHPVRKCVHRARNSLLPSGCSVIRFAHREYLNEY